MRDLTENEIETVLIICHMTRDLLAKPQSDKVVNSLEVLLGSISSLLDEFEEDQMQKMMEAHPVLKLFDALAKATGVPSGLTHPIISKARQTGKNGISDPFKDN